MSVWVSTMGIVSEMCWLPVLLVLAASPGWTFVYPPPAPLHPPNTRERIESAGYTAETHQIRTEDNYILTAFRIPRGKHLNSSTKRKPVILQHGILCSSDCWVITENCLGFVLADAGFDVWITNSRGNTYSRGHVHYSINDKEFWNFSFHELGYYDLPATIDYILEETDEDNLVYVGHSQGTAIFFVMGATRPNYHNKVKVMSALAPIAYLNNTKGAVHALSKISTWLIGVAHVLNLNYVLDRSIVIAIADHILCTLNWEICNEAVSFIVGMDSPHLDKGLIPYLADICPTGSSLKQLIHFNQLLQNGGKFTWYDYGIKNMLIYNSTKPPEYDLSKINIPILLYYGPNDYISSISEVKSINFNLPKVSEIRQISTYNHLDFMWARDVKNLLYDHLIVMLNKF